MRVVMAGLLAVLVIGAADRASASEYPWCADYNVRGGATNCGFDTYEQCRATVSGIGGFCRHNLFYRGPVAGDYVATRPRHKKRKHAAR
jgi:hypothetical protein